MSVVMGIDASLGAKGDKSSGTGIVILEDGKEVFSCLVNNVQKLDGVPRLLYVRAQLENIMAQFSSRLDLITLEDYSYNSKGNSVIDNAELGGLIRIMLHYYQEQRRIPYLKIAPSQVKKFILGKGNGTGTKKEDMKLGVYKKFGIEYPDNNRVDAYALAKIGEGYLYYKHKKQELIGDMVLNTPLTQYQKEVIAALLDVDLPKIKKPKKKKGE